MRSEHAGQPRGIAARHATLGSDAVDAHVAPRDGKPSGIALGVIVVDETEVEFGLRTQLQCLERHVIGAAAD